MGIIPRRTAADRAAEPRPRGFVDDHDESSSILAGPGDALHIDAKTGAAVIDRGGGVSELDFSGRDTSKERQKTPKSRGFDENLAERGDVQGILATIVIDLIEDIEAIKQERKEWEEMGAKGADLLGVKWEDASASMGAEGSISKTHHPMLLEAVMRSWANSRAELLPSEGPVKVRDDAASGGDANGAAPPAAPGAPSAVNGASAGVMPQDPAAAGILGAPPPAEPGTVERTELANALQLTMNHYLTVTDREYYADTSRMLVTRALKGSQFKKVYYDPILHRPVSRWVKGTDLLISQDCSHLSGASIVAERIMVNRNTVKRMVKVGAWRDVQLVMPTSAPSPTDRSEAEIEGRPVAPILDRRQRHETYECYLDLDEGPLGNDERGRDTRIALPYKMTIDLQSRECLELRRNWKKGDQDFRARRKYVHYGFVPGLGYYHWGFTHILGNPERAATALLREFIDAEMLASFPGGAIQKGPGTRSARTQIRPGLGEFEVVDTGGAPIDDFMKVWSYKGASPQLPVVLQQIVDNARRVAGTLEVPVGEGRSASNVAATTVMAFVDAISKVPSAIHKDDHAAQSEEFELLKDLLAEYPDCLECPPGIAKRQWTTQQLTDCKLVPAADPNSPSFVHRLMQGASLAQLAGLPQFNGIANQREVWAICLAILGFGSKTALTSPPQQGQAPPDPKAMAMMAKVQSDQAKTQVAAAKVQQGAEENQREAANQALQSEDRDKDRASEEKIEGMRQETEELRIRAQDQRERTANNQTHARGVAELALDHAHHTDDLNHQREQDLKTETDGETEE